MSYGKDELFATHEAAPSNRAKYIKTFALAAIMGAGIVALVMYLSGAKIGDPVRAPAGLEDAIHDYFLKNEKLETHEVTVYKCKDAYALEAWVTPPNNSLAGKVRKTAIAIGRGEPAVWEIKPNEADPNLGVCGLYQ
jgi:hypothetical protein